MDFFMSILTAELSPVRFHHILTLMSEMLHCVMQLTHRCLWHFKAGIFYWMITMADVYYMKKENWLNG